MKFQEIFTKKFMFEVNPVMLDSVDKSFGIIGVVLLLLAAVFKFAATFAPTPVDRSYRNRLFNLFLTTGILELVWYGLRYQNVRLLGSHFAALLVLAAGVVWFAMIAKDYIKNYRREIADWEKEQVKRKYLPQ